MKGGESLKTKHYFNTYYLLHHRNTRISLFISSHTLNRVEKCILDPIKSVRTNPITSPRMGIYMSFRL
jgi:hypothetical protein